MYDKNLFWSIKNSSEVLNKLKFKGIRAASLSTYDFSTLHCILPHNLIKEKLIDLIKELFKEKDLFTLLVMIEMLYSRLKSIKGTHNGLVRRCMKPIFGQYL